MSNFSVKPCHHPATASVLATVFGLLASSTLSAQTAPSATKPATPPAQSADASLIRLREGPSGMPEKSYAPAGSPAPPTEQQSLAGVWVNVHFVTKPFTTVQGESAPYNAAGQSILWHRINMTNSGTPVAEPGVLCRPPGLTRDMNAGGPLEIVQGQDKVVLMEEEGRGVRIIWMNAQHPKKITPSYGGHSIGHWEGDTLVVDTVGFNGKTWIDYAGSPHGKNLHVIERLRKVNMGGPYPDLQNLITIDDPDYYTKPWTILRTYRWRPDQYVDEYNCEENNRPENTAGIQIEDPSLLTGK